MQKHSTHKSTSGFTFIELLEEREQYLKRLEKWKGLVGK